MPSLAVKKAHLLVMDFDDDIPAISLLKNKQQKCCYSLSLYDNLITIKLDKDRTLMNSQLFVLLFFAVMLTYIAKDDSLIDKHALMVTSDPSYVSHGHITDVSNISCFDSKLKNVNKYYFYSEGKLYNEIVDYKLLSSYVFLRVSHNTLKDDPTKLVTAISNSEKTQQELKEMGIRVPVVLECQLSEKVIYNIEQINTIAVTPVKDVCPHGELILPKNNSFPFDGNNYVNYSVTTSDDGSLWIIDSWQSYQESKFHKQITDYSDVDDLSSKNLNVPVVVKCKTTPKVV